MARLRTTAPMNWYRFKIELSAWFTKTVLATFSALVFLQLFVVKGYSHDYPLGLRWVAEHEWAVVTAFVAATGFMWFCCWKAFRIFRADKRYGERF